MVHLNVKMIILGDSAVSESAPLFAPDTSGNSSTQKASFVFRQPVAPNTLIASKFVFQIYISVLQVSSFMIYLLKSYRVLYILRWVLVFLIWIFQIFLTFAFEHPVFLNLVMLFFHRDYYAIKLTFTPYVHIYVHPDSVTPVHLSQIYVPNSYPYNLILTSYLMIWTSDTAKIKAYPSFNALQHNQ